MVSTVLVGHSTGGLISYMFTRRLPERGAGLVLLDATHPDQGAHFAALLPVEEWAHAETWMTALPESHPKRPQWPDMLRQG